MKAISLTQPWATLIATGAKQWETRSWKTSYRGPIAIHAAKTFPAAAKDLCCSNRYFVAALLNQLAKAPNLGLPTGAVIAIARLTDCRPMGQAHRQGLADWVKDLSLEERAFGDYKPWRFAFHIEQAHPIDPIPAKGALGLWEWEPPADLLTHGTEHP